jgi:hypothetical protein
MGIRRSWVRSFQIAGLVASIVLGGAEARADDEPRCPSRTARTPGEILVPLGDSPGAPLGVTIVAGETLCLAGSITHDVLEPKLADRDEGDIPVVVLRLDHTDAATTLSVRSVSRREMAYAAAIVSGPANLALPTPTSHVAPNATRVLSLGPTVDRLLIHDVRFFDPPPPMEAVPIEDRLVQASFTALGGLRRLSVGAFDAPLRASGYGPLPRTFTGGGFAIDISYDRWRFELPLFYGVASAPSLVDSSSVGASVGDFSFDVGYDLLRLSGLTVFAQGGFGISALMMDTRDPHWTYVAQRTGVSSSVGTVEQDSFIFDGQVGIEQLIPLGRFGPNERLGLTLSLRGGYEQQFANEGWMTSDGASKPLSGLPLVDLSGGWVALGVGLGGYSAGSRPVMR